jgi:NitT/TauT family transport system ATP-binding protein
MSHPIFKINNVVKSFSVRQLNVQALSDVSLDIYPNDFVSIIGPSGCGKTTLLYLMAGFLKPNSGEILYHNSPVIAPDSKRTVIFQEYGLFPWKTVLQNVEFGLKTKGFAPKTRHQIALEYINLVHLHGFEHHYPYQLSGGMKQRVGIARALACDPEVILMDEPFAALDNITREILQEEIRRIWETTHKTFVLITHYIDEAIFLSQKVVMMTARPGRVKEIVKVDLPEKRNSDIKTHLEFIALKNELTHSIREEVKQQAEDAKWPALSKERGEIKIS